MAKLGFSEPSCEDSPVKRRGDSTPDQTVVRLHLVLRRVDLGIDRQGLEMPGVVAGSAAPQRVCAARLEMRIGYT
jgi:hypothetical protein